MGYRQVIIARKDLNLSPGKLAAQCSHASILYFTNLIKENNKSYSTNVYKCREEDGSPTPYKNPAIYDYSCAYNAAGKDVFYLNPIGTNDKGFTVYEPADAPDRNYRVEFNINADILDQWIKDGMTKTVCEAKNKNQLLKVKDIAKELGLIENKDYFCVYDKCLTELTAEENTGVTLTCIGFKPLPDEIAWKISKKYQLYR